MMKKLTEDQEFALKVAYESCLDQEQMSAAQYIREAFPAAKVFQKTMSPTKADEAIGSQPMARCIILKYHALGAHREPTTEGLWVTKLSEVCHTDELGRMMVFETPEESIEMLTSLEIYGTVVGLPIC